MSDRLALANTIDDAGIPRELAAARLMSGTSRLCEDCRWMRVRLGDSVDTRFADIPRRSGTKSLI